ncbi:MAG: VOC family protein [Thermoleophilia bacterium]|nr:VOC family protein [Thermoleophilia bacterium]
MFRRIDHIEVTPADFDRSLAFYTDVLGFAVRKRTTVDVLPIRDIVLASDRQGEHAYRRVEHQGEGTPPGRMRILVDGDVQAQG